MANTRTSGRAPTPGRASNPISARDRAENPNLAKPIPAASDLSERIAAARRRSEAQHAGEMVSAADVAETFATPSMSRQVRRGEAGQPRPDRSVGGAVSD